jgi:hypothetical protein
MPNFAQEQKTVDPKVRQQIVASFTKFDEAYNNKDAVAVARSTQKTRFMYLAGIWREMVWLPVRMRSKRGLQATSHQAQARQQKFFRCILSAMTSARS